MRIFALARDSWRLMARERRRTTLTVLGIIVGTGVLAFTQVIGQGLEQIVMRQLGMLTPDAVYVEVKSPDTAAGDSFSTLSITTLTTNDEQELAQLPNVKNTYSWLSGQAKLSMGDFATTGMILGVGSQYTQIQRINTSIGQFYTPEQDRTRARVAVLGAGLASDLRTELRTTDADLLGQFVRVGSEKLRIIGVLEEQGAQGFFDPDDAIYVPVRTEQNRQGKRHVQAVFVQVDNIDRIAFTADQITNTMRRLHGSDNESEDDFRVTSATEALDIVGTVTSGVSILLTAIAGISLLVGGVGIMNVMYVTVVERTSEIGLRKALGASEAAIQRQFLLEAVILTGLGGTLGIVFGMGLGALLSVALAGVGFGWDFSINWSGALMTLVISLAIGLLAGFAPARRAAGLDAILSLQS